MKDLTGTAVQSQGGEHGREIIETFKKLGVDTLTINGNMKGWYYGLDLNDEFFGAKNEIHFTNIITLDELKSYLQPEFPRVVWAWDDNKKQGQKIVMYGYNDVLDSPIMCYYECHRVEDIKKGEMASIEFRHFCEIDEVEKPQNTLTYNGKEVTKQEMLDLLEKEATNEH